MRFQRAIDRIGLYLTLDYIFFFVAKIDSKSDFRIDHTRLASSYHTGILSGFSLIASSLKTAVEAGEKVRITSDVYHSTIIRFQFMVSPTSAYILVFKLI